MIDWKLADKIILLMNELTKADPEAMHKLVEHRERCNEKISEHPTVQVSKQRFHGKDENGYTTGLADHVGILGILNGLVGVVDEGEKKGWGVVAAVYDSDTDELLGFDRLPLERCGQCRNPHHDGICSCGQWGEAEEAKAAEWHANNARTKEEWAELKRKSDEAIANLNAEMTEPIDKLESIW